MKDFFDKIYRGSKNEFYSLVKENIKHNKKMFIVTANPETFMNKSLNNILLDENVTVVADGIGIVKACKMLGISVKNTIPGIEIAEELLEEANLNGYSIALLGAKKEVNELLVSVINDKYPNINIVKSENGYVSDKDSFFDEISSKNVDVILVALGIPYQEELIYKHLSKFNKGIFVGVGGSFDVISGSKKRAPLLFRKLNIEWLYRLIKEPKRIKRFYNNNIKFIIKIKKMSKKCK